MADIRVLIADDESFVRDALADLIEDSDGMTVVALAADADEAIAASARTGPDVALVDVRMPGGGPTATRGILKSHSGVRVLAVSASGNRDTVLQMLEAGAVGYLVKGTLPSDVISGIRQVAAGKAPLSPEVAGGIVDRVRAQLDVESAAQQRRQTLVDQVSFAIDGDGLDMVYQPIVDIEVGRLVGVEALARFSIEPRRPPNEWFAAAAEVGLGSRLDIAALDRALACRTGLPDGVFMAVNLSTEGLLSPEVLDAIPAGFRDRVVVELTEHTPVLDYPGLALAFAPLRAAGASLAIDDAGSGYASLRHLLELAPQFIKLDICITQRLEHDRAAHALAVALTSFAREIDAVVIAEAIESESQLAAVRSLGIRLGQGYLLGRPGPIEQLKVPAKNSAAPRLRRAS
ncbi:MAG: hypothetical protein QOK05_938 [Chloroflexota bacterium]|nr:hypothetical protein [Chloroflexota bacterium]